MAEAATSGPSFNLISIIRQPTVILAIGLMVIIVMMVLPVPPIVLDIGLTASFAAAILVFTITLFIERPLDFSAFPSILLITLLLRLSLNISSTKLIIGEGHTGTAAAGNVIEGFAMFIMGGNLFMGLIIFAVLVIVNFLVITKGAGRMAEVGARFALDAMPGRQMAIDAEVAAGAISHEEARRLRELQQEETSFLGSLDGVSKFVKGDAVAGLLITMLNIVAGIAIGVGVHGISIGEAAANYSVLTVGDGLVSQIPAVVISIAAALLLSKGQGKGSVDKALIAQVFGNPLALGVVAGLLAVFALLPGLPLIPFMACSIGLGYLSWSAYKQEKSRKLDEATEPEIEEPTKKATLGDVLDMDEIHVELDPTLSSILSGNQNAFDQRIEKLRKFVVQRYGFVMPPVRVTDSSLGAGNYQISIQGSVVADDTLRIGRVMALVKAEEHPDIQGTATREPVYGADARWVSEADGDILSQRGCTVIEPVEVLATHLLESVQNKFDRLMSRRALKEALRIFTDLSDEARADANKKLLEEFVPDKVSHETLQFVMRHLLSERISVRNIPLILEAITEHQGKYSAVTDLSEAVRKSIAFQFIESYQNADGTLPVVQLSNRWDQLFTERLDNADGSKGALTADDYKTLGDEVQEALNKAAMTGAYAVVAVPSRRRQLVRDVLRSRGIKNPVISFEEIIPGTRPAMLAVA